MALWGVVVTKDCPVNHPAGSRRLRISQAIVDSGAHAGEWIELKCKVGQNASFSICKLFPGTVDFAHLNLEVEVIHHVVFYIKGPITKLGVHLSGYYIR